MLEGIIRESNGKKSAKALRRDGYLIANIYGKGLENISAAFKENEYIRAVRNKDTLAFAVKVDGKELNVVVQGYESQAVTGKLLHVDLMVAQAGVETKYFLPVQTVGTPVGLKNKGMLYVAKSRVGVKAAIENLPNTLELNVEDLDLGDSILVRDVASMNNVKFVDTDRVAILSIIKAK